tara:strand:+ start:1577 stop:2119 length:543 start_codon:yes stop_codon:yes gene_type:complete
MAKAIRSYSNEEQVKELALLKRIKVEQTFAQQVYINFQSVRFGIGSCCYTDIEQAVLRKNICDWQNAASFKVVVATGTAGVFVEPLAKVNLKASMSCPETPTSVCTILDLEGIIADTGTYSQCFEQASDTWTITHNLGSYPSVTVVDSANTVVVGNVDYISSQQLVVTFNASFSGCAFLN